MRARYFDETGQPESIINILGRYRDIEDQFPDDLLGVSFRSLPTGY